MLPLLLLLIFFSIYSCIIYPGQEADEFPPASAPIVISHALSPDRASKIMWNGAMVAFNKIIGWELLMNSGGPSITSCPCTQSTTEHIMTRTAKVFMEATEKKKQKTRSFGNSKIERQKARSRFDWWCINICARPRGLIAVVISHFSEMQHHIILALALFLAVAYSCQTAVSFVPSKTISLPLASGGNRTVIANQTNTVVILIFILMYLTLRSGKCYHIFFILFFIFIYYYFFFSFLL